jgi:transketolase
VGPLIQLKKRIVEIAYKNKLSHLGSYFSCLPIVDEIYRNKNKDDIFILSCGHASLAQYVALEKYEGKNAADLFDRHGGHPHRKESDGVYCSTGSLGMGLTFAVGKALANKNITVHCLISDGECAEGSIWESLKFIYENNVKNIQVYVCVNGFAAYDSVDTGYLVERLQCFLPSINIRYSKVNEFSFLKGLNAHYHIMNQDDYKLALRELDEKKV